MKLSFSAIGCLLFMLTFFYIQNVEAGFSNNGRMQSNHLNLSVGGTLDNNGVLIGTESATISCDTLSGKGLLQSPQISIKAKIFAYTGTIDCNGKCTIITSIPFDESMFKRTGGGEFIIVIDESSGNDYSKQKTKSLTSDYNITDGLEFQVD